MPFTSHYHPASFSAHYKDTTTCNVWVLDHFQKTAFQIQRKRRRSLFQASFCFFFPLPFFFAIRSNFVCVFYLIVLENELTFTVRGSFEETQRVSVGCDSHSPLPDPTFFHYAKYKQPSLDVAVTKKRRLPTFVRYPRTW